MAIDADLNTKLRKSIIESTGTSGQPGQVVLNPDGSNVGSSSTDGSTFTAGTTTGNITQGVYESTPTTVADGKAGAVGIDSSRNVKTTMGTALSKTIDSITTRPEGTTYSNITASTLVRTGSGILVGMYVNSTSSGTIKFWDQTSAASPVINNTITPAIGYHMLGNTAFGTGLYATIANTLDVTIYYIPTP